MLTLEQKSYYMNVIHEYNRAIFFGNVPNYEKACQDEIARLEKTAIGDDYKAVTKKDLDDNSVKMPYGEKKGSPKIELVVKDRIGIEVRRKTIVAL